MKFLTLTLKNLLAIIQGDPAQVVSALALDSATFEYFEKLGTAEIVQPQRYTTSVTGSATAAEAGAGWVRLRNNTTESIASIRWGGGGGGSTATTGGFLASRTVNWSIPFRFSGAMWMENPSATCKAVISFGASSDTGTAIPLTVKGVWLEVNNTAVSVWSHDGTVASGTGTIVTVENPSKVRFVIRSNGAGVLSGHVNGVPFTKTTNIPSGNGSTGNYAIISGGTNGTDATDIRYAYFPPCVIMEH